MSRYVITDDGSSKASASNNTDACTIPSSLSPLFTNNDNLTTPVTNTDSPENEDYELTYDDSKLNIDSILEHIHRTLGIIEPTAISMVDVQSTYYNRFKVGIPNEPLMNACAHVFFVRPDLNLTTNNGTSLATQVASDPLITYSWNHNPTIIKQLVQSNNLNDHDFMLYLSNKATSFSLTDEELTTSESSQTYGGWKVPYGRTTIPSKTSSTFTIDYYEDINLTIYELHKIWVDYIANVYHGKWSPKAENIKNKIYDYMSSVYYILCANDGETIIFWSKYTGVFPTMLPSSEYSFQQGTPISADNPIRVEYKYAWKEDFNPEILVDFNKNAHVGSGNSLRYQPIFDPKVGYASPSWTGWPFIELCKNDDDSRHPYEYKLRFLKKNLSYTNSTD